MAEDKKKKYGKGYVSGLRKPGESFMDFTNRRHEELYPGHRAAAKAAGASGLQAFGGKHRAFVDANRAKMPWLQEGQRYKSADWQRMLANQRGGMYGGTAGQVGGAPPGTRPAPTVGPNYNVLGGGQRPAIAPLQRKTAYMADPRNQAATAAAQIRQTGGDASVAEAMYSSPWAIGQRRDFPPVNYQRPPQYSGPARSSLLDRPQVGPPGQFAQPQLHMADLARMQQQAAASRRAAEQRMGGGLDFMREYPGTIAGTTRPTRPTQQYPLRPGDPFPYLSPRNRPYQYRF